MKKAGNQNMTFSAVCMVERRQSFLLWSQDEIQTTVSFLSPYSNLRIFYIFKIRLQVTLCEASRRKVKEGNILIPIHQLIHKLPVNNSKTWS